MQLTIDFTDEQLRGITAAREAHNASLPEDSTDSKETDEAYLTFVMLSASDSYAKQYPA
jgi:hypothetical protein